MNSEQTELPLLESCESGNIYILLEDYILSCAASTQNEASNISISEWNSTSNKKTKVNKQKQFPNLAGFCRYLKTSTEEFEKLSESYPYTYSRILTVLEDEALNSGISTTVISAYLKKRLGYDTGSKRSSAQSQMQISFEHDIFEDGE